MAYTGQPVSSTVTQIPRAKISDGKSVRVTVPESTSIKAQTFALVDGFFGLAMQDVATGAGETSELTLSIDQAEYETDNITTADTYSVGSKLYYSGTSGKLTTTATDNRLVGIVTSGKDSNNVISFILLPQQG